MTVLDDLRALETRVASRMGELRPLVDEYHELEEVAERLGLRVDDSAVADGQDRAQAKASRGARAKPPTRAGKRAANAAPGHRQAQVLETVAQHPGITVRELGARLDVDPTSLYRIIHRLEREGAVKKDGRELRTA
jgi:MarR family